MLLNRVRAGTHSGLCAYKEREDGIRDALKAALKNLQPLYEKVLRSLVFRHSQLIQFLALLILAMALFPRGEPPVSGSSRGSAPAQTRARLKLPRISPVVLNGDDGLSSLPVPTKSFRDDRPPLGRALHVPRRNVGVTHRLTPLATLASLPSRSLTPIRPRQGGLLVLDRSDCPLITSVLLNSVG